LIDDENQVLQEAFTDAGGLARLKYPTNAQWIAAALGNDFHALKIEGHGISLYSYDIPYLWHGEPMPVQPVLVFSDREFYRPNEMLHLKALARDWTSNGLVVPSKLTGKLECMNARGESFFSTNVQFSGRGACAVDVLLPAGPCGDYTAHFQLAELDHEHAFQVREFQPNPFELTLRAKSEYAAGDKVEIPVSARYYFGKPLTHARVKWTAEVEEGNFKPAGFDEFSFLHGSTGSHPALSGQTRITNSTGCPRAAPVVAPGRNDGPRSANCFQQSAVHLSQFGFLPGLGPDQLGLVNRPGITLANSGRWGRRQALAATGDGASATSAHGLATGSHPGRRQENSLL
jgi:hypothetical protein